jgi:hypothetical protein
VFPHVGVKNWLFYGYIMQGGKHDIGYWITALPEKLLVKSESNVTFRNMLISLHPTPQAIGPPIIIHSNILFNMFLSVLYWRLSPAFTTRGCAMSWWWEIHLTFSCQIKEMKLKFFSWF